MKTTASIFAGLFSALILFSAAPALRADARRPATVAEATPLLGTWLGNASVGRQSAVVGLEFSEAKHGVLVYATLPPLHAWRMAIGYVEMAPDGTWALPDWKVTLRREGQGDAATLRGELGDPRVVFAARRDRDLPQPPPEPVFRAGPLPVWSYAAGAALWAPVAVADGIVFAGDTGGRMHAVTSATGKPAWVAALGAPLYGAPLVAGDSVFVYDDGAVLHCLDRRTGKERWRATLGTPETVARELPGENAFEFDFQGATPVLAGNTLYIVSADGVVHALAADTGHSLWRHPVGAKVRTAVAVANDRVFVAAQDNFVRALDRRTGAELWRFDTGAPATSAPVVAGDLVLAGSRSSWLTALDGATGMPRWAQYHWFSWVEATGALADGTYYVGSSDLRAVRAIDPRSGEPRWETDVLGWAWGTPALTSDTVFIGTAGARKYATSHTGGVLALDRATGAIRWRRPAEKPADAFVSGYPGSGAISGSVVVFPNVNGTLEAYPLH